VKIATFNVNSIRKRLPIVLAWLKKNAPDVLCLQETKVTDPDFPVGEIQAAGYLAYYRGMKSFNGVATLLREKPDQVIYGLEEGPDSEDFRIIQTVVRGIPIINSYVPQGHAPMTEKFAYKLKWFSRLRGYFEKHLDPQKPAVWLGDLNVAPEPIDVYDPVHLVRDPDFHPDARRAYEETLSWGFIDVFRRLHPTKVQYTYWDFFRDHFNRDRGWRIDHILATAPLAEQCSEFDVDKEPRRAASPSDHTVVWANFKI
jgi:exodeoxyribonuclease-3